MRQFLQGIFFNIYGVIFFGSEHYNGCVYSYTHYTFRLFLFCRNGVFYSKYNPFKARCTKWQQKSAGRIVYYRKLRQSAYNGSDWKQYCQHQLFFYCNGAVYQPVWRYGRRDQYRRRDAFGAYLWGDYAQVYCKRAGG